MIKENKNQKVIVTAGGSGIGFEIAKCFLLNGADVFICDNSPSTLNDATQKCCLLYTSPSPRD